MKSFKSSLNSLQKKNIYKFDKVTISSNFDTGNICEVTQVSAKNFIMTTWSDGYPYIKDLKQKAWFHFNITGFEQGKHYISN